MEYKDTIKMEDKDISRATETLDLKCDPCENENETATAVGYCKDCEEHLCDTCFRAHGRLRATKHHEVSHRLEESKDRSNKTCNSDILDNCPIHVGQKLEFFCKTHKELSCFVCKSIIHSFCQNVEQIAELKESIENEEDIKVTEKEIRNLEKNVADTSHCVSVRLNAVKLNHEEASSYIAQVRKEVNERLDERQNTVIEKINEFRKKDSEALKMYGNKCKDISFKIHTLKYSLRGSSRPHDKTILFKTRQLTKTLIRTAERDLLEIQRNDSINRYNFVPDEQLLSFKSNLQNNVQSFGVANINPSAIRTSKVLKSVNIGTENELKNYKSCHITGIEVLSDGQVIVAVDEGNKTLKLIDTVEGKILSTVMFDHCPWDVTSVNDTRLAITIPMNNCIALVEVRDNSLKLIQDKVINVGGNCYGIAGYNGNLIVTFCNPAKIEMLKNDSGESLKVFKVSMNEPRYVALDEGRTCFYVSDFHSRGNGVLRWCLTDNSFLQIRTSRNSGALAVDKLGCLFSVRTNDYSVAVNCISNESVSSTKQDDSFITLGGSYPTSISYSNERNILFIGTRGHNLLMYYVV